MTTSEIDVMTEALYQQACDGRGLWTGLYLGVGTGGPVAVAGHRVDDPHLTLHHFGRYASQELCVRVMRHLADRSTLCWRAVPARVDGVARFASWGDGGNPLVALVPCAEIRARRGEHASLQDDREDAQWRLRDYTPHVTLGRVPTDQVVAVGGADLRQAVLFTHVGVTCGSAHGRWPLVVG